MGRIIAPDNIEPDMEALERAWEKGREAYVKGKVHLLSDLRSALKKEGAEDVLLHLNSSYAVDMEQIECDYYRYLEGDKEAVQKFTGEYMSRYNWAEPTCAYLLFGKPKA